MIGRGPSFLTDSAPRPPPLSCQQSGLQEDFFIFFMFYVNKLSLIRSLPVCRRSSLKTGEQGGGEGTAQSRIIPKVWVQCSGSGTGYGSTGSRSTRSTRFWASRILIHQSEVWIRILIHTKMSWIRNTAWVSINRSSSLWSLGCILFGSYPLICCLYFLDEDGFAIFIESMTFDGSPGCDTDYLQFGM